MHCPRCQRGNRPQARASSGSRSARSSMEPLRSANSTVTCLRSPSRAAFDVRIRSARCLGVYASGDANRVSGSGADSGRWMPSSDCSCARRRRSRSSWSSRICTGWTPRPRPCWTASSRACPPRARSCWSAIAPSTAMAGAGRPTTSSCAWIRCRPRAPTSCSTACWAPTPPCSRSRHAWPRAPAGTRSSSRRASGRSSS